MDAGDEREFSVYNLWTFTSQDIYMIIKYGDNIPPYPVNMSKSFCNDGHCLIWKVPICLTSRYFCIDEASSQIYFGARCNYNLDVDAIYKPEAKSMNV